MTDPVVTPEVESKKWYMSTGVWGGILSFLAVVAQAFGYHPTVADQASVLTLITTLIGAVGSAVAVIGRVKATKVIK